MALKRFSSIALAATLAISITVFWATHKAYAAPTIIILTDTADGSWDVPADWNDSNNSIQAIGGGGAGFSADATHGAGGGGGGAYSVVTNANLPEGTAIDIQVGAGGSAGVNGEDSFLGGATCGASTICAKGGTTATDANGAQGGLSTGVGTQSVGGNGAAGSDTNINGGGGGGAAGPGGEGKNGGEGDPADSGDDAGGGGGGAGGAGATAGGAGSGSSPGNGGNGPDGTGGGAAGNGGDGSPGDPNTGGGGGGGDDDASNFSGGDGGTGDDITTTPSTAGAGGGGGGGAHSTTVNGGDGGLYGGGGGGGHTGNDGETGAQGVIVITYTPAVTVIEPVKQSINNGSIKINNGAYVIQ